MTVSIPNAFGILTKIYLQPIETLKGTMDRTRKTGKE